MNEWSEVSAVVDDGGVSEERLEVGADDVQAFRDHQRSSPSKLFRISTKISGPTVHLEVA